MLWTVELYAKTSVSAIKNGSTQGAAEWWLALIPFLFEAVASALRAVQMYTGHLGDFNRRCCVDVLDWLHAA